MGLIFVIEVVGAAVANSLADAGHVLTDVTGIALALAAVWFGQRPATTARTYGYLRLDILAAVANAVLLLLIGAFVLLEALQRLSEPPDIASGVMLGFALVGLAANGACLLLGATRKPRASACAAPTSRCSATSRAR